MAVNAMTIGQHIGNRPNSPVGKPKDLLSDIGNINNKYSIEFESQSQHNKVSKNTYTTKVIIPDPPIINVVNGVVTLFYKYWHT